VQDIWQSMRSSIGLSFQFRIILMTFSSVLIHLPFLRPTHPLRAPPGATEQQRFQANAAMVGQIRCAPRAPVGTPRARLASPASAHTAS
jgi:hypothetical protein